MSVKPDSRLFYLAVGNNIKKYRSIRNFSLQDVAERIGVTKKTIQRYENGEIKIDMDRLSDVAEALDVKVHQIIEGAETFLGVNIEELNTVRLPVVGRVSCGDGVTAIEEIEGHEETPRTWVSGGDYFYVRAEGDSMMNARIFHGDLLLIRKQEDVEEGEIAAVVIDEKIYLKRVYKNENGLVLFSENPQYSPIYRTEGNAENIRIIGKLKKIIINM